MGTTNSKSKTVEKTKTTIFIDRTPYQRNDPKVIEREHPATKYTELQTEHDIHGKTVRDDKIFDMAK